MSVNQIPQLTTFETGFAASFGWANETYKLLHSAISHHAVVSAEDSTTQETSSRISRTTFTLLLITSIIAYNVISYMRTRPPPGLKRIPGPISTLPYVGRVHDVNPTKLPAAMKRFVDKYNGLIAITISNETHIWIGRSDIAFDLLSKNGSICVGRADLGAYPKVTEGKKYLPLLGNTEAMHRQRRFVHTMMTRNIALSFSGVIGTETKQLLHSLLANPSDFHELTYLFCARISSRLSYGSPDSAPHHVQNARQFIHHISPCGPIMNLLPFLMSLPEWLLPAKKEVLDRQRSEAKLWYGLYEKTKEEYMRGGARETYVSGYLDNKNANDARRKHFDDENEAINAIGMLCTVAIVTIAGPVTSFIMTMILHPEWQDKIRAEIDAVTDGTRMVEIGDTPRLPLLRAAMKECLRWRSTVPLGVPRLLSEDYSYEEYHFPKDSVVHVLDVAIASQPSLYPDAETYNPDRWLNPAYSTYEENPRLKGHHIFGQGKRMCPGQDLVEAEMLIFCGNMLAFFEFGPKIDGDGKVRMPDPDNFSPDVIGGPLPFECEIKIRSEARRKMIEEMWRDGIS